MQIFREQGKRRETNKRIIIFVAIVNLSSAQIIAIFSTIHELYKSFMFLFEVETRKNLQKKAHPRKLKGK